MMEWRKVIVKWSSIFPGKFVPSVGRMIFRPGWKVEDGTLILPKPVEIVVKGSETVSLPVTGNGWYWSVEFVPYGVTGFTKHFQLLPGDPINIMDIPSVDPDTITSEIPDHEYPSWWAALQQIELSKTGPQGEPGERGPQGRPGRDGVDGKDGVDGIDGRDGTASPDDVAAALSEEVARDALNAVIDETRTYSHTQTYDTSDGTAPIHLDPDASRNWNSRSEVAAIGPDLILRRHDGNAGQRLALTGRPGMTPEIMPYYEVVAATRTGTDGGAAVAGYQLHLGPDDGAGNNREFFYIEAAGENHAHGPHFRIGEHASGTGKRRPLRIETAGTASLIFDPARTDIQVMKKLTSANGLSLVLDGSRTGGNQTIVRSVVYADGGGASGAVFLGHNGGTESAPTAPGAGWTLGTLQLGAMNGTTQTPGAQFRALTSEAWTIGTAQGTRAEIHITPKGATVQAEGMRVEDPQSSNQAGFMVRVNRDGTKTLSQVTIGPPDSAGTGYRVLRVAN